MSIVRISKEADKKLGACVGNSIPYFAGECNSKNGNLTVRNFSAFFWRMFVYGYCPSREVFSA